MPASKTVTSATVTLRFDDGSKRTYEIHEGAKISVQLRGGRKRETHDNALTPGRWIKLEDDLHMELHASATGKGTEFVTVMRIPADGEPRT